VQIAREWAAHLGPMGPPTASAVVAALAERYAFVDHAEYARLVAELVEEAAWQEPRPDALRDIARRFSALDASPAETAAEG
jgi:hypothetical protein